MNELIIFVAEYSFVLSLLAWLVYELTLSREGKIQLAVRTIIAGLLAFILAKLAGHFISDPRPFAVGHFKPLIAHAADNGFPSDHTLLTSLIGFVVLTVSKRWGSALLIAALLIGSARVASGIHHPLDIVGAFVISGLAVILVLLGEKTMAKLGIK